MAENNLNIKNDLAVDTNFDGCVSFKINTYYAIIDQITNEMQKKVIGKFDFNETHFGS